MAFVTGASRGIGRGIALALAERGFNIVAAATRLEPENTEKGLYEVKRHVEAFGVHYLPVAGNIAVAEDRERMLEQAMERFGAIDVLVNNAGVAPRKRLDILETTEESYDRVMDINLRGPFFLSQAVARFMTRQLRKQNRPITPSIIFITSISAYTASPNRAEYCISKAGLSMAAQNFAVRLAEEGISVYEVRPGIIQTDMTAAVKEKYDALIREGLLPQRRWGTPEDVGKAVAALAEGWFPYSTGQVIDVDGGFHISRL